MDNKSSLVLRREERTSHAAPNSERSEDDLALSGKTAWHRREGGRETKKMARRAKVAEKGSSE